MEDTTERQHRQDSQSLNSLERELDKAKKEQDWEAVACIENRIARIKGLPEPYSKEWFEDL